MVKKLNFFLILLMFLFIFSTCKEFYTFNLFDGLDFIVKPSKEKLAAMPTEDALDDLEDLFESDSFMEEIKTDEEAAQDIEEFLADVYNDPDETEENRVSAAVMAAELELAVTGGDELVDNIWDALSAIQEMEDPESTATEAEVMQQIIEGLIPESILEAPTEEEKVLLLLDVVEGIMNAADIYETLGNEIISDPTIGNPDITGGIVIDVVVAGLLDTFITSMMDPGYQTPEAATGVLLQLYNNPSQPELIDGFNEDGEQPEITDLDYLMTIGETAGLDLSALFGDSEPPV